MANYECVFMARPDVSAAQVEALTTEFTEIVTTRGGDVVYNEYWGLRPTAYRIKKNRKAHYVLMHISARKRRNGRNAPDHGSERRRSAHPDHPR